jgi:hypothetical protein
MPDEQRTSEELNRELSELLQELRVALPGVQVLFGFLLAVPFARGWSRVTHLQRGAYFVSFLCTAFATIFLIAPSAYHRLLWRRRQKEFILESANRLALLGTIFLALAMLAAIFLIADLLFRVWWAVLVTALMAAAFGWFWYLLPLARDLRARR